MPAPKKMYKQEPAAYERKLQTVMTRMGVGKQYKYDYGRFTAWVEFFYKGRAYRFEQSIEKAAKKGIKLCYGSDCFAQVVLWLEALARAGELGIYTLQAILEGLPALPAPLPECFRILGFSEVPLTEDEIRTQYKVMAKTAHPDAGGSAEAFSVLQAALNKALAYVTTK